MLWAYKQGPLYLVPLPLDARPSNEAKDFTKHIHAIHANVRQWIALTNEGDKIFADLKRRLVNFHGDMVMVHLKPERLPKGVY